VDRRRFLIGAGHVVLAAAGTRIASARPGEGGRPVNGAPDPGAATLFVCGDVMTGRGIDQILPHAGDPTLHEPWMTSARSYLHLAEQRNGPIPRPVDAAYVWGSALEDLAEARPGARIVNLETSVTTSDQHWPGKGIHYRMHPDNVPCLVAAGIDCCVLANNHVLDWGHAGLDETLRSLRGAALRPAGAGCNLAEARQPAIIGLRGGVRVVVFAFGVTTSGIPRAWAATAARGGVNLLEDLDKPTLRRIAGLIERHREARDLVVASLHWGGNWGYEVPAEHRRFAHGLIDAGVDVIHGHSSHHPLAIEVYRERPVLYGCGDLLNDYEGIAGHERFRGDLGLLYFLRMEAATGRLIGLDMAPQQVRRFRLTRPARRDRDWLRDTLNRESRRYGCGVDPGENDDLRLRW
jgi:poly-gamma-glutamate synthesis protein (capsule biosynthesis protein)